MSMLQQELDLFVEDDSSGDQALTAVIHTTEDDIPVFNIVSFDIISDFTTAYTDRVVLKAMVEPSPFIRKIALNRNNLEMTIAKRTSRGFYVTRYKAVIPDSALKEMDYDTLSAVPDEQSDKLGLIMVELHGKHLFADAANVPQISGTFGQIKVDALLSKAIKHFMGTVSLPSGQVLDECVITPVNNQQQYKQITIPVGTPILRLPSMLQSRYGVYTSSIGSYLRPFEDGTKVWWIYPQYEKVVWTDTLPTLKVLIMEGRSNNPKSKVAMGLRNTIQRDGNTVIIIAQVLPASERPVDTRPVIRPNTFKVVDADAAIESRSVYQAGSVTISGGDRYKYVQGYDRSDDVTLATAQYKTTNNYYQAAAAVTANTMATTMVRWEYAISELLIPGMLVNLLVDKTHYIEQSFGRLAAAHSIVTPTSNLVDKIPYQETCLLTLYTERKQ